MAAPTMLPVKFQACANQDGAFSVTFTPSEGVNLTGAVLCCQIKSGANAKALLSLTPQTSMEGDNLIGTFPWTASEVSVLPSRGPAPTNSTNYDIQIDMALAPATTDFVMRFWGTLEMFPGGPA